MSEMDVMAVGRCGMDLYAEQVGAPFDRVKSFAAYVGGTPANIAVGMRRLGLRAALVSAVSRDPVGDFILRFLQEEGVDTSFLVRKPHKSGVVLLGIMPPDRFPRVHYRDDCADQHLTVEDLAAVPLGSARMLVVTGTSLTHSPGREATLYAAEEANRRGVDVVLDLDYRSDLWADRERYADEIRKLLAWSGTVIGTTEEITAVGAAVQELLDAGPHVVVEKRGAAGCRLHVGGAEALDVPGFSVEVQNALGAGDAFAAGYLYGRLSGWTCIRSARLGNACGAIVVTRHACSASCPTLDEALAFVDHQGGFE